MLNARHKFKWIKQALLFVISGVFAQAAYAVSFNLTGVPNVQTMIINLSHSIPSLMRLVTAVSYVLGFVFIVRGILELRQLGEQRTMMSHEHHLLKPIIILVVGTFLLYLPSAVHVGLSTFWTDPTPYAYVQSSDMWSDLTNAIFMIIQLIGTISFIRGLILFTHVSGHGQPGTIGRAFTFVISGIFCINLYQFLQVIFATLGLGQLS